MGRHGQLWSHDYVIGFVLFLVVLTLGTGTLVKSFQDESFTDVLSAAQSASEQLMRPGYPVDWRDDVVSIGLLTDEHLSMRKAERLSALAEENITLVTGLLNMPYRFGITLRERNGTLIPIGKNCSIGDLEENKTPTTRVLEAGYYYRATDHLKTTSEQFNASLYQDDEFPNLLANLTRFEVVILEQPELSTLDEPYPDEMADSLERYVRRGGRLVIVGDFNLSAFDVNTTRINTTNATNESEDDFLNLTGITLNNIDSGAALMHENGQRRFATTLDADGSFAARFTHGDGDVHFLGSVTATVNETGQPLLMHLARALNESMHVASATCHGVDVDVEKARHVVNVERLAAYKGRIVTVTVTTWERQR